MSFKSAFFALMLLGHKLQTHILSYVTTVKLPNRGHFGDGPFVRPYRIILKTAKFPMCNTWGTCKSPVPRVTHGEHISHLSVPCPMCNTWGTIKSDLNSQ